MVIMVLQILAITHRVHNINMQGLVNVGHVDKEMRAVGGSPVKAHNSICFNYEKDLETIHADFLSVDF